MENTQYTQFQCGYSQKPHDCYFTRRNPIVVNNLNTKYLGGHIILSIPHLDISSHHIFCIVFLFWRKGVQRTVVASEWFPWSIQVISHDMNKVQVPIIHTYIELWMIQCCSYGMKILLDNNVSHMNLHSYIRDLITIVNVFLPSSNCCCEQKSWSSIEISFLLKCSTQFLHPNRCDISMTMHVCIEKCNW